MRKRNKKEPHPSANKVRLWGMMVWSTITDIITYDRAFVNTKNKKIRR